MASFERNPGNPVRATFYLLVTIEIPDRARSHRQQIEPLDIQSYLPKGAFRMVIFPMRASNPPTARSLGVPEDRTSYLLGAREAHIGKELFHESPFSQGR